MSYRVVVVGVHDAGHRQVWHRSPEGLQWAVGWLNASGELAAYLAIDRPPDALQARGGISARRRPDPTRLSDPAVQVRTA